MSAQGEQVPERWQYLGRRELSGGRLGVAYRKPDGETAHFAGRKRPKVVGGLYEVTVVHDPDGLAIVGEPRFLETPSSDDVEVAQLEAEDRAAATAHELRRAETRAARSSRERFGELTLRELRETYLKAPPMRAAALIGQVLRYLGAA